MSSYNILFVTYGGGHVRMALPVAKKLAEMPGYSIKYLGLTTAAKLVKESGLELIQFSDLIIPQEDDYALRIGAQLSENVQNTQVLPSESQAYLGLSYADLIQKYGEAEAALRYARYGRHAFLPVKILERALIKTSPHILIVTNSPRSERAAAIAARKLNIPVVCLVDLFATDEVEWIASESYANTYCVLNDTVRDFLVSKGCDPKNVHVTGNPAFDRLSMPKYRSLRQKIRNENSWEDKYVLFWPMVDEPDFHPFSGEKGDPSSPTRALSEIVNLVLSRDDLILCVRPRPGQGFSFNHASSKLKVIGDDWDLAGALYSVDLVLAMSTTVAVEAHIIGTPVVKVLGSVFDRSMPLVEHGMAIRELTIPEIKSELSKLVFTTNRLEPAVKPACENIVGIIKEMALSLM